MHPRLWPAMPSSFSQHPGKSESVVAESAAVLMLLLVEGTAPPAVVAELHFLGLIEASVRAMSMLGHSWIEPVAVSVACHLLLRCLLALTGKRTTIKLGVHLDVTRALALQCLAGGLLSGAGMPAVTHSCRPAWLPSGGVVLLNFWI